MNIRDLDLKLLYHNSTQDDIVLDGPSLKYWDEERAFYNFMAGCTSEELVEAFAYIFSSKYPNFIQIIFSFANTNHKKDNTYVGEDFKRIDIVSSEWKYYIDERVSKYWGVKLIFQLYLETLNLTFTQSIIDAKEQVISGLNGKKYKVSSTPTTLVFTVEDSPIKKIELNQNTFILTVNKKFAVNYYESPEMLKRG